MTHKTPDGCTILLPDMDIHAFVSASRADFVQELLAKNPTLPATQLTKGNLVCCVLRKIARLGQAGPFSAHTKAQVQGIQRQWLYSTAGDVLHELFDGKIPKTGPALPASVLSASLCQSSKIPPPMVSNNGTNPIAMDTKRPATAPRAQKCVDSNQSLTQVKPQSKLFRSKAMLPYNANVVVQMAQFLERGHRKKLIQNGNCLLVSLSTETGHTLPTDTTHAHLLDRTDQAASLRRIRLITAGYASIALEFENEAQADLAARQIEGLKFQFEDNDPIKLDVQEFSDNPASANATYTLGSGPLHFCDYQESLQRFFCKEGFVPIEDVITTRRTGTLKTEVLIRYRFSPGFMEKFSALPGGPRDNRIPAEPAESCSLCPRSTRQDRLQSIPNQPYVKPSSLPGDNGGANAAARPFLKVPGPGLAATYPSLDDLKITTYIAVFTLLNGVEATMKVSPRLFARGLNKFLNTFYPDSDFESRLAVLHRIDGGERAGDWELLCKELRRHFAIEYMSDGGAPSSKRKSLADDEAARKRPKRAVAADYM